MFARYILFAAKNGVRGSLVCGALFIGLAFSAFAQEAQISFTEGGEFALTSGGRRQVYQGGRLTASGLSMRREDILQTGQSSFVELRLEPGGTRIKIAENTSLISDGAGPESGSVSFTLLYGRVRLSTAGSLGEGNIVYIKAGQAQAVFRRGDTGVDFIVNTAESSLTRGEPALKIYCFSGRPELIPPLSPGIAAAGSTPKFAVNEYESLSIETMNPLSYIERRPVDNDIIRYWNRHNFSGGMPLLSAQPASSAYEPAPAIPAAPETSALEQQTVPRVIEKIQFVPADNSRNKKMSRAKNIILITGIALSITGIALQGSAIYSPAEMDGQLRNNLINYGYLPLGMGLLLGSAALAINPLYTDTNAGN